MWVFADITLQHPPPIAFRENCHLRSMYRQTPSHYWFQSGQLNSNKKDDETVQTHICTNSTFTFTLHVIYIEERIFIAIDECFLSKEDSYFSNPPTTKMADCERYWGHFLNICFSSIAKTNQWKGVQKKGSVSLLNRQLVRCQFVLMEYTLLRMCNTLF